MSQIDNDVTIRSDMFVGGFMDDQAQFNQLIRLAMLGQVVLATPNGLADLWSIERRHIGKIIDKMARQSMLRVNGIGWVREIEVNDEFVVSRVEHGCTSDLTCTVTFSWKLPDGPVSLWRGRGLPKKTRDEVLRRDGHKCVYCGETEGKMHVDHVVPVAKGGGDDLDNLVVACVPCNLSKSDKLLKEWGGRDV